MLHPVLRTLVKVAVASERLMREFGLSVDRLQDYARRGIDWALPNVLLGSIAIVPIGFLIYLFRPPGVGPSGNL